MRTRRVLLSSAAIIMMVGGALVTVYYFAGQPGNALSGLGFLCPPICATGTHSSVVVTTLYLRGNQPAQQSQINFICTNGALESAVPSPGWVNSSATGIDAGPGVTLEYCGTEGFGGPTITVSSINLTLYYKEVPAGADHFSAYLTNIPCQPRAYDPYYPESQPSCYITEREVPTSEPTPASGDCARTTITWTPSSVVAVAKGEPLSLVLFFPHEAAGGQGPYSQSVQVCSGSNAGAPASQPQSTPSSITIKGTAFP